MSENGTLIETVPPALVAVIPRLALRAEEAASALGVSRDYFREHVASELRWARRGRLKLVAVSELEDWLRRSSARVREP